VLAVAAVLILAALGAYGNSFNVPFLLDDQSSISDNPSIRHLGRIGDVLTPPPTGTTAARPLVNLTYALNYAWGGMSVRGYHVANLLLHICAGLTLLGIVRRTLLLPRLRHRYGEAALPLAAFVALLWTLHPLQTEAVTYISQRAETLMGLFYLLTLYGFIRSVTAESRNCWLILSVAACLCGMATKQVMVTAPVLVLLYDRAFVSGSFRSALANRRWYYASLAATWVLLGFLMQLSPQPGSVGFQTGISWPTYALTELRVVAGYLKLAFWPHPLVFDYGSEILTTGPRRGGAIRADHRCDFGRCRDRVASLADGGIPRGVVFFDPGSDLDGGARRGAADGGEPDVSAVGGVVVLVTLLSYSLGRRRAFVVLGMVAVGLGRADRLEKPRLPQRTEHLGGHGCPASPHLSRAQHLGLILAEKPGRLPDAVAHCEEALRLKPDFAQAHNNLANVLAKLPGRMSEALAHFEEALRLDPNYVEAHSNFANALAKIPGGGPRPSRITKGPCASTRTSPRRMTISPLRSRRCPAGCPGPSTTSKRLCVSSLTSPRPTTISPWFSQIRPDGCPTPWRTMKRRCVSSRIMPRRIPTSPT